MGRSQEKHQETKSELEELQILRNVGYKTCNKRGIDSIEITKHI